jgi:hypothetical protein
MNIAISAIVLAAILNTTTAVEPCSEEYSPVDCGQFAPQEFDNICFAEKAGFDPKLCLEVKFDEANEELDCTREYDPVICVLRTVDTKNILGDVFPNLCVAKTQGGYYERNCSPYEFEEIVHLMNWEYGEDFCQYVTPRVAENKDAVVLYICDHDGWQPSSLPIKAKLTASGLLSNFPVPVLFSVEYDESGNDSDSLQLLNDATDLALVKYLLKL